MKHLKTQTDWKKETLSQEIQHDLFQMAFELKDEGFDVSFQAWPPYERSNPNWEKSKYPYIGISKWSSGGCVGIEYSEISEFVERVKDYLDGKGFNTRVRYATMLSGIPTNVVLTSTNVKSVLYRVEIINREIYGDVID